MSAFFPVLGEGGNMTFRLPLWSVLLFLALSATGWWCWFAHECPPTWTASGQRDWESLVERAQAADRRADKMMAELMALEQTLRSNHADSP